jgi:type IV pilus assembly protein PilM
MELFGRKKIHAFGLEISNSSIKAVQLAAGRSGITVQGHGAAAMPDKVINNNLIASTSRLAENILRVLGRARGIDTKYVVCSIPEAKSFVRTISLPKMAESEIDGAIPYELEQDIPVPVDQVYLDWQLLRESGDKLELLVMAAPKDYVDALAESLTAAKLVPVAMELESLAAARALMQPSDTQPVLIADVGTLQTSFVIADKGIVEYTSSVPVAGNAFTESIARNLGVNKAEAEKLKITAGLTAEDKKGQVRPAIVPILDNMIDEIKNVIRFFEEHDLQHRQIQKILLCGGSAALLGMSDYMAARINLGSTSAITVSLGHPAATIGAESLAYNTAIGLALRGLSYEAD